jgi:hypothetical protein
MKPARFMGGAAAILGVVAVLVSLARVTAGAPFSALGWLVGVPGAVVVILTLGALYEWLVHRFVYHGPSRVPLLQSIHVIHQRGHHWHRFPPDRYVEAGPVERIPVFPAEPYALCGATRPRLLAWAGQYALYMAVGVPLAFVPAWLFTHNPLFTASCVVAGVVVCYFFIRVHDVIHYPAERAIERQAWFRFLDRHHYIHHIDNTVNLNFLLPLGDWLFGTLKRELTAHEAQLWPSFEQAKRLPPAPPGAAEPGVNRDVAVAS